MKTVIRDQDIFQSLVEAHQKFRAFDADRTRRVWTLEGVDSWIAMAERNDKTRAQQVAHIEKHLGLVVAELQAKELVLAEARAAVTSLLERVNEIGTREV